MVNIRTMDNLPAEHNDMTPKASHAVSHEEAEALFAPPTSESGTNAGNVALNPDDWMASNRAASKRGMEGWYAIATALLYLVFFRVSTLLPFTVTSTIFVTLASMVLMLVFTVRVARALIAPRLLTLNCLLAAVFALPLVGFPILLWFFPTWGGWPQVGPIYMHYTGLLRHVMGLKELLVIWLAASMGVGISRLIREMKLLLPAGIALGLVDLMAVFSNVGVVNQAITGKSQLAQVAMTALTVKMPATHATSGSPPLQLQIGFADFLFIALFFACFKRFGVSAWNTFVVLCAVLSLYMLIVAFTATALPALVPIAVVVIGMNLRQFRYDRSEAFALLYATLIIGASAGAFWLIKHR